MTVEEQDFLVVEALKDVIKRQITIFHNGELATQCLGLLKYYLPESEYCSTIESMLKTVFEGYKNGSV